MSDQGAYALLKTIRGQRDADASRTSHSAMTRVQENDRWLSVKTSAVPIHTTQIDIPEPTQELQPQLLQQRPHNFGFYREVLAKHDQAMRQFRQK